MPDHGPQTDPLQPQMPRIPGVNDGRRAPRSAPRGQGLTRQLIVLTVAALALVGGGGWWVLRVSRSSTPAASIADPKTQATAAMPPTFHLLAHPTGPERIATVRELSRPWSSKKFTFYRPDTGAGIPAMVIRLPGVAGNHSNAYWAFSLNAPYETCQLAYVTNLNKLETRFDYPAHHPMVISSCSGSIYDPLQVGTAPDGAWVRGEIVKGSGIRPPIAIDVRVHGREIIADKIEE